MAGPQPDFHRLEKFQPIDFDKILPGNRNSSLSDTWKQAIAEKSQREVVERQPEVYSIEGTWDGRPVDHDPARLTLEAGENQVIVRIEAPYFNDLAPPGGKAGEAFFKLWDYEVVETFFLNGEEKYLELEFGPHGQHLMLMLNGNRNAIK